MNGIIPVIARSAPAVPTAPMLVIARSAAAVPATPMRAGRAGSEVSGNVRERCNMTTPCHPCRGDRLLMDDDIHGIHHEVGDIPFLFSVRGSDDDYLVIVKR